MTESLFVHALHRTHVLKEATAVVIEIEDSSGSGIKKETVGTCNYDGITG